MSTFDPSALNTADRKGPVCPLSSARVLPVAASQTRAPLSQMALSTFDPSALNAADWTPPECHSSVTKSA